VVTLPTLYAALYSYIEAFQIKSLNFNQFLANIITDRDDAKRNRILCMNVYIGKKTVLVVYHFLVARFLWAITN
jgi:1,4-dihydroxy-2-naphthoate octaprenyltransferase